MSDKPKLNDQDTKTLRELYDDVKRGMHRALGLGMFCIELKHRLPHGQFQAALEHAIPEISYRSIANCMEMVHGVFTAKALSLDDYLSKVQQLHFSHGGEIFLLPEPEIPAPVRSIRRAADELVAGKSQRELLLQIKSNKGRGDFHPPNVKVQAWLKEHHPDLAGLTYTQLAENHPQIAAAFKKQFKPDPIPTEVVIAGWVRQAQHWLADGADILDDDKRKAALPDDLWRQLSDFALDLHRAAKKRLKGKAKRKGQGRK